MKPLRSIASMFVGKGSFTDMGDRYPILDRNQQSSIKGLYAVGDISGIPDIKAAIHSGHELARHLAFAPRPDVGPADCEVLIIGGGPAGVTVAMELQQRGISYLLLERKRLFNSIASLGKSRKLYLADAEKHFTGKRLLVIASDACSLAFETACKLAAGNDVTLACEESHEHAGETKIDCGCVDVVMTGSITFLPSTKVTAVQGGEVSLESPQGPKRLSFDHILPMTRFEQEVPVETLKAFGLKYENRWDLARLCTFIPVLLVVAAFYTALKLWGWEYRWLGRGGPSIAQRWVGSR